MEFCGLKDTVIEFEEPGCKEVGYDSAFVVEEAESEAAGKGASHRLPV